VDWSRLSREQKSKHIAHLYKTFTMDDLCDCEHTAVNHYALNQMPCVRCDCDGLKEPSDAWVESLLAMSDDDARAAVENRPEHITLRDIEEWCWERMSTEGIQRLLGIVDELGPPKHDWRCASPNCTGCW
jgi:hypothetical protein